jgi:CHAD domain-containing protein
MPKPVRSGRTGRNPIAITAMSPSQRAKSEPALRGTQPRRYAFPRLNAMMACDTAFRVVARRSLGDLIENHEATCNRDPEALHQVRIALTRLRTAILFFSPMVADSRRTQIREQLKWLNGHLGAVRDLDVAIERLKAVDAQRPRTISSYRSWLAKRLDSHRLLTRILRSARYRRLIEETSDWVERGSWSTKRNKKTAKQRASPIAEYSTGKLKLWQKKLLKKRRKLQKMGTEKRHRLRLLNKKLCYSIEFFEDMFRDERFSRPQAALKHLRKAQKCLGQLNDDAKGQSLATALRRDGLSASVEVLGPKREKRLIRKAAAAYKKLAAL